MELQSLVSQGLDAPLPRDRIHAVCGRLLGLRLRFRGNCRALYGTLTLLTAEDFVSCFEQEPPFEAERFLAMLSDHRFAKEFAPCFGSSRGLGHCIDGIVIAWREAENLMADAQNDFADPIYASWPMARATLWGLLTAIGRGDFYVASLLDWHNGLGSGAPDEGLESVGALNAYLARLERWAGLRGEGGAMPV